MTDDRDAAPHRTDADQDLSGEQNLAGELTLALGRAPGAWRREALRHNSGNAVTVDVARYRGEDWSVVGKHVGTGAGAPGARHWAASNEPAHWNYWRREIEAYRSGLAERAYAGAGIAGPALLHSADRPGGGTMLWLADATGRPGTQWSVDDVAAAAGALGRGQGAYLAGRALPDVGWLSRRFLRQYVTSRPADGSVLYDAESWQQPLVAEAYVGLAPGLRELWERREWLLDLVEWLPQTLAHCDVWPANMLRDVRPATMSRDGGAITLLDWSFVGLGAVGEDAGNLVTDSVWDGWLPAQALPELAERVWRAYLGGLRTAGWTGPERLARLGFCAGGAVKYAWLAESSLRAVAAGSLVSYGGYSAPPPVELLKTYAAAFGLLLAWVAEVRELSAG